MPAEEKRTVDALVTQFAREQAKRMMQATRTKDETVLAQVLADVTHQILAIAMLRVERGFGLTRTESRAWVRAHEDRGTGSDSRGRPGAGPAPERTLR